MSRLDARRPVRALASVLLAGIAAATLAGPLEVPKLAFTPPAAGSYRLERIMPVPDGPVLDSDGAAHRLSEFSKGKVTLFSFIYTYCTDAKGCPRAYATLHSLKAAIEADRGLHERVRFVSMSFDPDYDTPLAMRAYGGQEARDRAGLRWYFLTARSRRELLPLLEGFGQDVSVAAERPANQRAPVLGHLLKVYLIDAGGTVREIYTTAYLHPAVLLNDIRTLLQESTGHR